MDTQHYIIFNPAAGIRNARERLQEQLAGLSPVPYTMLITNGEGDAARLVREVCAQEAGPLRFYAAGGDGTLGEVASALMGNPQAAVGVWPCGSGNDYARMLGGAERFLDLKAQLSAPTVLVDMIRVNGKTAINVVNLGLEAYAAAAMVRNRHHPLMGGPRAYYIGVLSALVRHMRTPCTVSVDGETLYEGDLLTASFASGQYVGGGFKVAPRALHDDGLMEVCLMKPVSLPRLMKQIGSYKAGEHLDSPAFADILLYKQASRAEIRCERDTVLCLDGEIITGRQFDVELVPRALRFILPGGGAGQGSTG